MNSNKKIWMVIATVALLLVIYPVSGLPVFAEETGKLCYFCHQNPEGGGPLTRAGEEFKTEIEAGLSPQEAIQKIEKPVEGETTPSENSEVIGAHISTLETGAIVTVLILGVVGIVYFLRL